MIITYKWLADFVDILDLSPYEIADKFTMIGYEVDEVKVLSKGMERVFVGQITKLARHPNAERLQICTIDIGQKKPVQILTAATNVYQGAFVPVALDGADLPNGMKIKSTDMRGEISQGMLCSGEELCVGNDVYPGAETHGVTILDPKDCSVGDNIATVFGMDDVVYDISVLSNRPDCQSVKGLAKELAAVLDRPLKDTNFKYRATSLMTSLSLEIQTDNCPFYLACVVKDIQLGPSPQWLQTRLRLVGLRPINNIIDITNYVLWELGQPMHAFDYNKIKNETIIVRNAKNGEKIEALNGETYTLNDSMTVIADATTPIGIAGVMGGKLFSVSENTTDIVLESAVFNRANIRKTSRALGLRSDASARYERGVEPVSAVAGLDRALALIQELKIGKINNEIVSNTAFQSKGRSISFPLSFISKLLGITIPEVDIVRILGNLGIVTTIKSGKVTCLIPTIRTDIMGPADIVEEIIRLYGYQHIESSRLENTAVTHGALSASTILSRNMIATMTATGAHQAINYSFTSPAELDKLLLPADSPLRKIMQIANPLSLDYSIMRTQMLGGLLGSVASNYAKKNKNFALFEIGKVFVAPENDIDLPTEINKLAYITTSTNADFFTTKSILERIATNYNLTFIYKQSTVPYLHPNICADVVFANKVIGHIGKVHPKVMTNFGINAEAYYFEINLDMLPAKKVKKVKQLSRFPSADRDLAVLVDVSTPVGDMVQCITRSGGQLLQNVEVFDVYAGAEIEAGKKNVAFTLTFQKMDATLLADEINTVFNKIVSDLNTKFNAKLR